jgi:hypothetical protein
MANTMSEKIFLSVISIAKRNSFFTHKQFISNTHNPVYEQIILKSLLQAQIQVNNSKLVAGCTLQTNEF